MRAYGLRTDGRTRPREVEGCPRFTWRLASDRDGVTCASFSVGVMTEADGRVVWSSGRIDGDAVSLAYDGPALPPCASYRWELDLVDTTGAASTATGFFETGFEDSSAWRAEWIGRPRSPWIDADGDPVDRRRPAEMLRSWRTAYSKAPLQLRRAFHVRSKVRRGRLRITAHGVYRAHLNGLRVGEDELTPGWTRYESTLEYQAYDITDLLQQGSNAIAVTVADGWWSGYVGYNTRSQADQYGSDCELLARLDLEYEDGTTDSLVTDGTWRELSGDVVMADLLMGEYRDSTMATTGWTTPAFDDSDWRPVEVRGADLAAVRGQTAEPIRVVAERAGVVSSDADGVVVDFGQNLVGRIRLRLHGEVPGAVVTIRHGETLDGAEVYTANLRTAEAVDRYVAAGGEEVFEPAFTFHGFRYARISGVRGVISDADVTAVVLSSDLEPAGGFHCSIPLVNRLHSNIVWSQRSNFVGVPTDCPQRDERLGWTADIQVFGRTSTFNSDVKAFLERWLRDLMDSQDHSGGVPDVAPVPPTSTNFDHGAPGWGDAVVIVPWLLYATYGDERRLAEHFPHMVAWVDHIDRINSGGLWERGVGNDYGDWLSVGAVTSKRLIAAAYQIRSTDLVALAARALGQTVVAERHEHRARSLRDRFAAAFLASDSTIEWTQTACLLTLAWDLAPSADVRRLATALVADIESRGRRLTTGFLGAGLLCPTLSRFGETRLAFDLLLQTAYPSWGFSIEHGATTIWERWDGWTPDRGFQTVAMNSFNHYSLGAVGEWLHRSVVGIDQAARSVGYRDLVIAPQMDERLDFARGWFESPRGRIVVEWRRQDGLVLLTVEIPPGSTAEIVTPTGPLRVGSGTYDLVLDSSGSQQRAAEAEAS